MLQNEHKEVKVDEILGREEAEKAIKEAMVRARSPAMVLVHVLECAERSTGV